MELRSAEEQVQEILTEYQSLCKTEDALVEISSSQEEVEEAPSSTDDLDAGQVLSALESLHERLDALLPKMDRFRKRLGEKDPITEAPRYGEQTMARVKALLTTYDALVEAIRLAFGEADGDPPSRVVVEDLRLLVAKEQERARQEALEQEEWMKKQQEEEKAAEEQRLQEERQREQEARLQEARERDELARRAQQARVAREEAERRAQQEERRAREEIETADREWMASIAKGPGGVREQLQTLSESTASDPGAYTAALNALHMLFSQIVSHPEEVNFRRVRRDHAQFHKDIGQYAGGRELLIAAGFRLGAVDDVACFISTEPDIEKEMDAWSEWFDLLKATLEILEQELIK